MMAIERGFVKEGIRDSQIEEFLKNKFDRAGYSHIEIQRTPLGTRIVIFVEKPGLVIGRSGRRIDEITNEIRSNFELENPMLDVREVENPFLEANIVATKIARSIERGVFYKKVTNWYLGKIMESGALGVEIRVAGKLGGERGRFMKFKDGYIKHAGYYADNLVDVGYAVGTVKLGSVGVQVRILKDVPDDLSMKIKGEKGEDKRTEEIKRE